LEGLGKAAPFIDILEKIFDANARQAGADRGAQLVYRTRDSQSIAFLEFKRAIDDGRETVVWQAAFGGPRGPIEFRGELGQECLPVGRQSEALVGLLAGLLPFPVIIDQVPEGDVIAALHQEQTAGAQGVAHREGEGDFPDGTVEMFDGLAIRDPLAVLAFRDQMGTPVRLHEAVRIIRRQRVPGAGIQGTHNLDGLKYCFAAGGGLEWQGKEAGRYWRSVL